MEEVHCTATKKLVAFKKPTGGFKYHDSHGECYNCKHTFHESYLALVAEKSHYPVRYDGAWCNDCVTLDPTQWANPPKDYHNIHIV